LWIRIRLHNADSIASGFNKQVSLIASPEVEISGLFVRAKFLIHETIFYNGRSNARNPAPVNMSEMAMVRSKI
jgi:hypothetical protein